MRTPWLVMGFCAFLVGCTTPEASEEPGAKGPVVLRWWDKPALDRRSAPTVIRTDALQELGTRFGSLAMHPVQLEHPIEQGTLWVEAAEGSFSRDGGATNRMACPGPVRIHGWHVGRPFVGAASRAAIQAGGRELELFDFSLVQGGRRLTTPRAAMSQGRGHGDGPFRVQPDAPAILATLAAVPDRR